MQRAQNAQKVESRKSRKEAESGRKDILMLCDSVWKIEDRRLKPLPLADLASPSTSPIVEKGSEA